jgi:outer membrane protein TolC
MIKKIIILIFLVSLYNNALGQSLSEFLKQVSENNPEIQAYRKLLDARKLEARTGLTPSDPFISAGFMPGNAETPGTKKTWSVTQSFAFPTKYLLQNKINKNTIVLAEQEFNQGKLLTLLNAKLSAYDLIYNTKALDLLKTRKAGYDNLQSAWKTMLDNGETTIMDYNKIMMELSAVNLEMTRREVNIEMVKEKLKFMSGSGNLFKWIEEYPVISESDPENLIMEKSAIHPAFLIPEIEYQIRLQEVKLSKTGSLPEFQVGYASEIVPGETYTGAVGGITIPLWANSNRIKTAVATADHSSALRDAVLLKLKSQIRSEFANMKALEKSISEIRGILVSGEGTQYLDTALSNGEISVTTYFLYLDIFYQSEDRLLELENEYQKSLATLLDHELIK